MGGEIQVVPGKKAVDSAQEEKRTLDCPTDARAKWLSKAESEGCVAKSEPEADKNAEPERNIWADVKLTNRTVFRQNPDGTFTKMPGK